MAAMRPGQLGFLARVHARGGLVEQQQLRPARERTRDFEPPLRSVGQVARICLGDAFQPYKGQQLPSSFACFSLFPPLPRRVQERIPQARVQVRIFSRQHVVDGRHEREQPNVLKRARDAGRGDAVRRPPVYARAAKDDLARRRRINAGDRVEQRRLAGPVRADDGRNRTGVHTERHVVHRNQFSEALRDALKSQHDAILLSAAGSATDLRA